MNIMKNKRCLPCNICRLCLTENNYMKAFSENLNKESDVTVLKALEDVMQYDFESETIKTICNMCNGLLGIAHDLILQFQESTNKLEAWTQKKTPPRNAKKNQANNEISKEETLNPTENYEIVSKEGEELEPAHNIQRTSFIEEPKTDQVDVLSNSEGTDELLIGPQSINNLPDNIFEENNIEYIYMEGSVIDDEELRNKDINLKSKKDKIKPKQTHRIVITGENGMLKELKTKLFKACEETKVTEKLHDTNTELSRGHSRIRFNSKTITSRPILKAKSNYDQPKNVRKIYINGIKGVYKSPILQNLSLNSLKKIEDAKHRSTFTLPELPNTTVKIIQLKNKAMFTQPDPPFVKQRQSKKIIKQKIQKTELEKYTCENCQNEYSSKGRYLRHLNICVQTDSNAPALRNICFHCQIDFPTMKELKEHVVVSHEDQENYFCPSCDFVSISKGTLRYHMLKHEVPKFSCDKCGKRFYAGSALQYHLEIHNKDKTIHLCTICGKSFHYSTGLKNHMRCHNNERRYVCKICNKRCLALIGLKDHMATHTGIRPHRCSYCDKTFSRLGTKRKHELIHKNEKRIQCKYCEKGFNDSHNYKLHLMMHPGNFFCRFCDKTFIENVGLQFHEKYKHNVGEEVL